MKKLSSILFIISLISLAIGLSDAGSNVFSGLSRAMGAVFFVLAYITRVIEKAEAEQPAEVTGKVESPQAGGKQPTGRPLTPAQHAH
jgi:hypothetical protein